MKLLFENLVLNNLHGNPVQFIRNASCREQSVFTEKLPLLMESGCEWRFVLHGSLLLECSRLMTKALGVVWSVRERDRVGAYFLPTSHSLHRYFFSI